MFIAPSFLTLLMELIVTACVCRLSAVDFHEIFVTNKAGRTEHLHAQRFMPPANLLA